MVTSDFRLEVEMSHVRAYTLKNMQYYHITTFTVCVTDCDFEKYFSFNTVVEITCHI